MNTLTPHRQTTNSISFARTLNSVAAARNVAAQELAEVHHAWGTRLTRAQAAHLMDETAADLEQMHAQNTQHRVLRLQLEALALATILGSIVVTCASLVLG